MEAVRWPESLETLTLLGEVNAPIEGAEWPLSPKQLFRALVQPGHRWHRVAYVPAVPFVRE